MDLLNIGLLLWPFTVSNTEANQPRRFDHCLETLNTPQATPKHLARLSRREMAAESMHKWELCSHLVPGPNVLRPR